MKAYDQRRERRVRHRAHNLKPERKALERLRSRANNLTPERKEWERVRRGVKYTRNPIEAKHLYVMTFVEIPGIYKIGRSSNVTKRKLDINRGIFLTLQALGIYENAGHLELKAHDLLALYRVESPHTREWFKCSTEHIHQTVTSVINSNSALSPEGDPLSPSGAPIRLVEH